MLPAEKHVQVIKNFINERNSDGTRFRLATVADSEFLLGLRLDPTRNQNISATSRELKSQVSWMESYLNRFNDGNEAYFIIEVEGQSQGTLRLYDYLSDQDSFCWGSWIIRPGAPALTAYQSAILVYDLAFGALKFTRAHFEVRQANISVWKFHEKMGAKMVREDNQDRFYEYSIEEYKLARIRLQKFTQNRNF
jgi:RimJ/RimL family protein N-acetyltransferase